MYAKTGDSLSIEFTVNNTIASSNASILESGLNQTITQTSRDLNYTVIVPSTQREEYANFNVQVTDIVGETLSITEVDLPFNVFIDTVSPRIDLGGPAEYFIITGTVDSIIPNVTVTDGDPNYSTAQIYYRLCLIRIQGIRCALLKNKKTRGEYNLVIWTPLSLNDATSA